MKTSARHARLRELLRAGDPLPPDEELSGTAARRMRQGILASARPAQTTRYWQVATIAASLLAVVAVGTLLPRVPSGHPGDPSIHNVEAPPQMAAIDPIDPIDLIDQPTDRQIQFTTRGGTRVIWLLKPKLQIETQP